MSPRVIIVLAVLLGLLFFVGIGLGAANGASGDPSPNSFTPSSAMEGFGNLLTPLGPKLELPTEQLVLSPGSTRTLAVPTSSLPLRRATLSLRSGQSATIVYIAPPTSAASAPSQLLSQSLTLPRSTTNGDPRSGSLVVLKEGGTLRLTCGQFVICTIHFD